jgi:hypothetical protein
MQQIEDLIGVEEPAIELLKHWVRESEVPCEILPPSAEREEVLLALQVTTHSTLGALAYETGGLLVDDGWLRLLGSGHSRLARTLSDWNAKHAEGYFLVGDDAAGGFFAINGGALGPETKSVYYWAPDNLDWECLELGFTDFVQAFLTSQIAAFYKGLRWPSWRADTKNLFGDRCFSFYPFLWTKEGSLEQSQRATVPVSEAFDLKVDIVRQLSAGG